VQSHCFFEVFVRLYYLSTSKKHISSVQEDARPFKIEFIASQHGRGLVEVQRCVKSSQRIGLSS